MNAPVQDTPTQWSKIERDAIESLKELVTRFPRQSINKSNKTPYDIVDVSIDTKKTDSLICPVIGIINFTKEDTFRGVRCQLFMQMVFDWQGDHWTLVRLLNRKNGIDFTHRGGGEDILGAGPMSDFLKEWKLAPPARPVRQAKIAIAIAVVAFFFVLILFGTISSNSDSTDEKERTALVHEGEFLSSEMERANREHDWSRVHEIRQRNRDFLDHGSDYLTRHGRTPPKRLP